MKTKSLFTLLVALMIAFSAKAQTQFDLQFGNPTYKEVVDSFCVTIQIRSSDEQVFSIGSHTFFFNYNTNSINFPTYQSLAFDSTYLCEVAPGYNLPIYFRPRLGASTDSGDANVTTIMNLKGLGCPEVSGEWIDAGIVCFAVIDPTASVNLQWNTDKTDVNYNEDLPRHEQGELMGLDVRPDGKEPDADNDGLSDALEAELTSNPDSNDSDGDGILDGDEYAEGANNDTDGDELLDILDRDDDGDGLLTADEGTTDTDEDGIADYLDPDDDGDSVLTADELPTDTDGDGINNHLDDDDDGDGFPTIDEGTGDVDGDGVPDYLDAEVTGIEEELVRLLAVELYPNPTNGDQVRILIDGEVQVSTLKVYNVKGALLQEVAVNKQVASEALNLSTGHLTSGIYFINVYDAASQLVGQAKLVMTR